MASEGKCLNARVRRCVSARLRSHWSRQLAVAYAHAHAHADAHAHAQVQPKHAHALGRRFVRAAACSLVGTCTRQA
eukprot:6196295-Pleurochrysis_carterae.AAC.2